MSDVEKDSSDEDSESDINENRLRRKVNPIRKFCCFLTEAGHSLNFILLADNMTDTEVTEATELIQSHMGTVSTNKRDVNSHCAVLVADEATKWDYFGDVFKFSYIKDCIDAGQVLDIAPYLKDPPSKLYIENFDYMNVIYYRKYAWETIPQSYKLDEPVDNQSSTEDCSDSDASIETICSFTSPRSTSKLRDHKHTHGPYTRAEKEAMLRFVVDRKMYARLKGKQIYKEMEVANICPIRTWQSMKDHFQRCLVKEINRFPFLSSLQKQALKDALYPYQ